MLKARLHRTTFFLLKGVQVSWAGLGLGSALLHMSLIVERRLRNSSRLRLLFSWLKAEAR